MVECEAAGCSRSMCIGTDGQCLVCGNDDYVDDKVKFICPPCHQDIDRKGSKEHRPYYVRMMPSHIPHTIFYLI
jgi:hypothetical protein